MKRRTADCGKLRRPLKKSKITEGIYGSTFVYVKFLMVWALVLMADFILEFRFEYLWPFWLLLRSVYDSFKFQGLAFSVFFVFVAITSDVICYLFIPVQWLFFAASTYVWVQYVWHTERGICLPTVSLWLLFVYIEASVRLREFKTIPFHLDLCRPFAAHCIGYPVVTLGFCFKGYVCYRMRLRKQKDVQKDNDFYIQLLQQALPADQQNSDKQKSPALPSKSQEEIISNGVTSSMGSSQNNSQHNNSNSGSSHHKKSNKLETTSSTGGLANSNDREKELPYSHRKHTNSSLSQGGTTIEDYEWLEQTPPVTNSKHSKGNTINDYDEENSLNDLAAKSYKQNGVTTRNNSTTQNNKLNSQNIVPSNTTNSSSKKGKNNNTRDSSTSSHQNSNMYSNNKDDSLVRLEADIKRLKMDLQDSRSVETDLRSQILDLSKVQKDNESLQNKLHNLVQCRQQDKQNVIALEKKLAEEKRLRSEAEKQLTAEKKAKKAEEVAAKALAMASNNRNECTEVCKNRRRELENEVKQSRRDTKLKDDQLRQLERETQTLRQYKDTQNETEVLMSALAAMQDKNAHLENSLSAENRLKLELFSALGEAKRRIEILQGLLQQKETEIQGLKGKCAEAMALMPSGVCMPVSGPPSPPGSCASPTSFPASFSPGPSVALGSPGGMSAEEEELLTKSSLNPMANDYTPKLQTP